MINNELVKILRCPETHQTLTIASSEFLEKLIQKIDKGELINRAGDVIDKKIAAGLVRNDGQILYPIIDDIPVLLIEQGIVLG